MGRNHICTIWVVQWLALLLSIFHMYTVSAGKKIIGSNLPQGTFLCGLCSSCCISFLQKSSDIHVMLICASQLAGLLQMSIHCCLSVCFNPVMDWWSVQGVPSISSMCQLVYALTPLRPLLGKLCDNGCKETTWY